MPKLQLPERFYLVVGDTFELFYKGIINAINTDCYDVEFTFSDKANLGNSYKRKYVFTPEEKDVGEHTLFITLRGNDGEELDTQSVILEINPKPVSPEKETVILIIGDSIMNSGNVASEFYRRLTATDGSPVGYGLQNIKFI